MPDDAELAERWADDPHLAHPEPHIAGPLFRSLWGDIRGRRVLGCGGAWPSRLAAADGAVVTGFDCPAALIARARGLDAGGQATYTVMNASDLEGLPDGGFDLVICQCCLQDVREHRAALREFARVLRPGGRLVVSVPGPGRSTPTGGPRPRAALRPDRRSALPARALQRAEHVPPAELR